MGTSANVEQFVGKIKAAATAVEKDRKEQLSRIGKAMEETHMGVIESALHGPKFHHWNVPIAARARQLGEGGLSFAPVGKSKGPERVAEQGRHQGNAGGFSGPGINTRTGATTRTKSGGLRKVGARKGKRWNGRTEGKETWTKTTEQFAKTIPQKLQASVYKAVSAVFR